MINVIDQTFLFLNDSKMNVEGVLLTGGSSSRMGTDKAGLVLDGITIGERTVYELNKHCVRVTALGREPIANCEFLPDETDFAGPLIALSRFSPLAEHVFVVSCDLPRFDSKLIPLFHSKIEGNQAVMVEDGGHLQPLCALYRSECWLPLRGAVLDGNRSLMSWLDRIQVLAISGQDLELAGLNSRVCRGANSPEELASLLAEE